MDADTFRGAAEAVGERLCREAVWHADRCTWTGDHAEPGVPLGVVHRPLGADLYQGTAGVGWFLAHLWAATGASTFRDTARGALAHALARSDPDGDLGLYTGAAGIALAVVTAAARLDDAALCSRGGALAEACARAAPVRGLGHDLVSGAAGVLLALLALHGALGGPPALREAAVTLGRRLADAAEAAPLGRAWPGEPGEPPLCGLGHGASGIGLALDELARRTGDARLAETAAGAFLYERSWFSREQGGWPDLRELTRARAEAGERPGYPPHWCHGSAGIGLVRLWTAGAARRAGGEAAADDCLAGEAAAAVDHATAGTLRVLALPAEQRGHGGNLSLCHGVGSVAELHLVAAELTGNGEHLDHARGIARRAFAGGADGSSAPPDPAALTAALPCGVYGGGETQGLLLGLAGIGTTLLRLADPTLAPTPALVCAWDASR